MNFKRHKPRKQVKCELCTPFRYGNSRKAARRALLVADQKYDFERKETDVFR